ncbi:hypothetical protein [Arundinibacter roseus]|uniref:hypothetical protein n=1 Tax=Arundinibacter roseus TaxID=2070510 RepID=UPI001404411F|nr:hypothetical protein [Arundinibacter roseus]
MKELTHKSWGGLAPSKKTQRFSLDQTTLLSGLAILIFAYIILRFIYPLIDKGVLW